MIKVNKTYPGRLPDGHFWTCADKAGTNQRLKKEELSIINHLASDNDPLVKRDFNSIAMVVSEVTEVELPCFDAACIVRFKYLADVDAERFRFIGVVDLNGIVELCDFRYQILDMEYYHPGQSPEASHEAFQKIVSSIERK